MCHCHPIHAGGGHVDTSDKPDVRDKMILNVFSHILCSKDYGSLFWPQLKIRISSFQLTSGLAINLEWDSVYQETGPPYPDSGWHYGDAFMSPHWEVECDFMPAWVTKRRHPSSSSTSSWTTRRSSRRLRSDLRVSESLGTLLPVCSPLLILSYFLYHPP